MESYGNPGDSWIIQGLFDHSTQRKNVISDNSFWPFWQLLTTFDNFLTTLWQLFDNFWPLRSPPPALQPFWNFTEYEYEYIPQHKESKGGYPRNVLMTTPRLGRLGVAKRSCHMTTSWQLSHNFPKSAEGSFWQLSDISLTNVIRKSLYGGSWQLEKNVWLGQWWIMHDFQGNPFWIRFETPVET